MLMDTHDFVKIIENSQTTFQCFLKRSKVNNFIVSN